MAFFSVKVIEAVRRNDKKPLQKVRFLCFLFKKKFFNFSLSIIDRENTVEKAS